MFSIFEIWRIKLKPHERKITRVNIYFEVLINCRYIYKLKFNGRGSSVG